MRRESGILAVILLALLAERILFLIFNGLPLYADEAQYWSWAQALDWGFYSKPPMVALGIWFSTHLCGDGEACVRLTASIGHTITALLIYLTGRRLFSPTAALAGAVVYATLPAVWLSSALMSTDVWLLLFWALALYGFVGAMQTGRWRWWLLTGLAFGLGMQSKYTMLLFMASAFWWMLRQAEGRAQLKRPAPWVAALMGMVIFLPNLWWNHANGWVSFAHTKEIAQLEGRLGHLTSMLEFVGAQAGVFGPLLFGWLLYALATYRRQSASVKLLLNFVWPMLLVMVLQSFLSRAHANWAAAVYVPASLAVAGWAWERGIGARRLIYASLALHLAVGLAFHAYPFLRRAGVELPLKRDPLARLFGGPELADHVFTLQCQYPELWLLADERKLAATLIYYTRPYGFDLRKWNYDRVIDDHYELKSPLTPQDMGKDFLLVQAWPIASDLRQRFEQVTPLPTFRPPGNDQRDYYLYVLRGYRPLHP